MTQPPFKIKKTIRRFAMPSMAQLIQDSFAGKKSARGDDIVTSALRWDAPPEEYALAREIGELLVIRAKAASPTGETHIVAMQATMDVMCCHLNGCRLKLWQLLHSDASDFRHDVVGIGLHLDRTSGKLLDDFKPIFAEVKQ